jgi:LmbE family N-acetylglucosaminyl deacetylase
MASTVGRFGLIIDGGRVAKAEVLVSKTLGLDQDANLCGASFFVRMADRGTSPHPELMTVGVRQGGTLALSSHFDDVSLSIGGSLAAHVFPEPVCIYTVFGVSNYARGAFHNDWHAVTRRRRREESRFAEALGVACIHTDFLEAGLRIGCDFERSGNSRKPARFDPAIERIVREYDPRLLLCPLGIGDHWDHILVRQAVLDMKFKPDLLVLFYEDLPYADDLGPDGAKRFVALVNHRFRDVAVPINWKTKRAGLKYYSSQVGEDELRRVRQYTQDLADAVGTEAPCERFWTGATTAHFTKLGVIRR